MRGRANPINPRCVTKGCGIEVRQGQALCAACFRRLPPELRQLIARTSRPATCVAYNGEAHRDSLMAAIRWTWAQTP